jgi:hypothetical protein
MRLVLQIAAGVVLVGLVLYGGMQWWNARQVERVAEWQAKRAKLVMDHWIDVAKKADVFRAIDCGDTGHIDIVTGEAFAVVEDADLGKMTDAAWQSCSSETYAASGITFQAQDGTTTVAFFDKDRGLQRLNP